MEVRYYYFGKMSAEELAQHRQEYWEALSSGLDNCRYGLPFTEQEKREIFAQIPDSEIISNVEHGYPPSFVLDHYIYIAAMVH